MNILKSFDSKRITNVYLGWIIIFAVAMVILFTWSTVPSSLPYQIEVCTGTAAERNMVCRWMEPDTAYLIRQYYVPSIAFAVVYYAIRIGLLYIWKPFSRPKVFSNVWLYGLVAGGVVDVVLVYFYVVGIAGFTAYLVDAIQYAMIWAFILQIIGLVVGATRKVSAR